MGSSIFTEERLESSIRRSSRLIYCTIWKHSSKLIAIRLPEFPQLRSIQPMDVSLSRRMQRSMLLMRTFLGVPILHLSKQDSSQRAINKSPEPVKIHKSSPFHHFRHFPHARRMVSSLQIPNRYCLKPNSHVSKFPLQGLATDEIGPSADFGGDALLAGQLLAHALSKENGSLQDC